MNTAAAALEARVTVATIRTWCRIGAVAASKTAGRWVIEAKSLAHRIAIGAQRARKSAQPIRLEQSTNWRAGRYGYVATGPAQALHTAYQQRTPVTLTGDFEGDRLYLGALITTTGDHGIVDQPVTVLGESNGTAVYVIDEHRLDEAPRLLARIDRDEDACAAINARQTAADNAYLNNYYN